MDSSTTTTRSGISSDTEATTPSLTLHNPSNVDNLGSSTGILNTYPSSSFSSSSTVSSTLLSSSPYNNNNNNKFLAHNRAYQESMPLQRSILQRILTGILPYTRISWKDLGILRWLPVYTKQQFFGDLNSALVVSVILVPQGMAYALLAGLDPIYGLYSATIPLLVWMIFTSSSQVSPGPVAPTALLLESVARQYSGGAASRSAAFTATHFAITFAAGILQLILAGLRFGWIADLLSWPVMSGFASSAAFLIITSQLSDFFGLNIPKETPWVSPFAQKLYRAIEYLPTLNWRTTLISIFFVLTLLFWRNISFRGFRLHPRTPIPIILVLLGVLISWAADIKQYGVKVVGFIPSAMPEPQLPIHSVEQFTTVLPGAAVVMLISYVQTVSLAVLFGKKVGENISGTAEMVTLGSAWLVGSFFQSYMVAGSFTRTTVQSEAGARTPASIGMVGIIMIIFLFTLTRVLSYLPNAVLAAIVMASTKQLINFQDAKYLWKAKFSDFAQLAITFISVLAFDVTYGLMIGTGVSLLLVLYRSFRPRLTELGRLPGSDVFVALDRFTDSRRVPGIIVLRLDGELHFGNVRVITDKLLNILSITKTAAIARSNKSITVPVNNGTPKVIDTVDDNSITSPSAVSGDISPSIIEQKILDTSIDISSTPNEYRPGSLDKVTSENNSTILSTSTTHPTTTTIIHPSTTSNHAILNNNNVATNRKTRVVYALSIATTNPMENIRNTRRRGVNSNTSSVINTDPSLNLLENSNTTSLTNTLDSPVTNNTINPAVLGVESAAFVSAVTLNDDEQRGNLQNNRYILSPIPNTSSNTSNAAGTPYPSIDFVDSIVDLETLLQLDPLRAVIVDGSRVVDIDSTACREMQAVMETYAKATNINPRVVLLFAALPGPVRDTLDLFGLDKATDPATTRFLSVTSAIASIYERLDEEDDWEKVTQNLEAYADSLQIELNK